MPGAGNKVQPDVGPGQGAATPGQTWGKNSVEIDLKALNPDADGDGHLTYLEREIYNALNAADIDKSGSIGVGELYKVIGDLVGEKRKVKGLSRLVGALIIALLLALASIFGVSMLAGEFIKESKVNKGAMTTPDGKSAVAVDLVESTATLWDLPAVDTTELAKMKVSPLPRHTHPPYAPLLTDVAACLRVPPYQDLVFYADMSSAPIGTWVEATYKVAGVYKASNDVATIVMTSGEEVTIHRTTQTGTLAKGGATYAISDECTGSCSAEGSSRRLSTDVGAPPVEFKGPRTPEKHRRLGFFSALMTSGSFMMMQAGAFR